MNSVQENKNELEAAVRYCESAISRAQATIESMEFRQQAASKAWHEQTGREAALERELEERISQVADLKVQLVELRDRSMGYTKEIGELKSEVAELEQSEHDLKFQYSEAKTNMALMTDELEELRGIIDRMGDDSTGDSVTIKQLREETQRYKKAWREQRELVALRDDQIAMLERRLAKYTGEKVYPFKEGDIYYVFNQIDGTWIESVWDDESESMHDNTSVPDHPHKVYFTVDQKNVLDQFKPEDD